MLKSLIWYSEVSSTSDLAKKLPEFTCVLADSQSQGRGRQGRKWKTFKDSLMFSFKIPIQKAFPLGFLSIIVGTTLHKAVLENSKKKFFLKWPNDIHDEKGKKVAGILIETAGGFCIVGIGLNCGAVQSDDFAFLESQTDRLWILKRFFLLLNQELQKLQKDVLDYWYQHSFYVPGREIEIIQENSPSEKGKIKELALDGSLIVLNNEKKEIKITSADAIVLKVAY
ncbi:MAG: biotin--[acetyl-CoA-carboxylase] ligase [Candidatus Caenarcaniphilales bacterium]|nr:biotin--[acetyl-CoA-carboxylase] ligase [Candidatus Caenarcaniphilales bacterium]